jgi:hypothetical protein
MMVGFLVCCSSLCPVSRTKRLNSNNLFNSFQRDAYYIPKIKEDVAKLRLVKDITVIAFETKSWERRSVFTNGGATVIGEEKHESFR